MCVCVYMCVYTHTHNSCLSSPSSQCFASHPCNTCSPIKRNCASAFQLDAPVRSRPVPHCTRRSSKSGARGGQLAWRPGGKRSVGGKEPSPRGGKGGSSGQWMKRHLKVRAFLLFCFPILSYFVLSFFLRYRLV